MIYSKKHKGISLIEVLLTITIMIFVSTLIIQSLYQMHTGYKSSIEKFNTFNRNIEARAIFQNLINNSYISGNMICSFLIKKNVSVDQTLEINPFDYPLIYAQQAPLISDKDYPANVQIGTDILVLQTIDSPQTLTSPISSGDQSILRLVDDNTSSVESGTFMMLTDGQEETLLSASETATDNDNLIHLSKKIDHSFPSGSVLYTDYSFKIIYIRDTGQKEYALYEIFYTGSNKVSEQILLKGVSDLQISYNLNNTWQRVAPEQNANDQYKRLWNREVKGIKINYLLDGKEQEAIISFNEVGGPF
ncbi:pilus assembly FimT family protein [Francisella marina]|uniref:Type II secretion system protein n=1 Tax=Francisella marina TaxID=2249302 RepID=A0ABX5ZEB2_9GAMM|nr:type II secretion system protein [Francisella marina]QEO56593.1 type II secretion system protein [Francisella marina]QEO59288.1 type II secretion system protein [Francisella marina]